MSGGYIGGGKCKTTKPFWIFGRNMKSIFYPRFHVFRIFRFIIDRVLKSWLGGKAWGDRAVMLEQPNVVVLDHAFATEWIGSFIRQLKERQVPTISFPHSSFMFTHSQVLHVEKKADLPQISEDEFPWDCILVESRMRVKILNDLGIPSTNIYPLGCIRFTKWWNDQLSHIGRQFENDAVDRRPIVLYLASGTNITLEKGMNQLKKLMILYQDRIRFVVKVHARRSRTEIFSELMAKGIEVVGNEISSAVLINAADYVIITASSTVNDAILKGKKIVDVRFTMDNETTFAKYRAVYPVFSFEELKEVFDNMAKFQWTPNLEASSIDSYIRECVHGGHESENELIENCLKLFSEAVSATSIKDFKIKLDHTRSKLMSRIRA